mgnify:CR=1 FL=1
MKRKLLTIIFLSLTLLFAVPNREITKDHIHVYFSEKDQRIAEASLDIVLKQHELLSKKYGLDIKPLRVYIADSEKVYKSFAGNNSAIWSVGLASDDKLLVKSPSFSRQSIANYKKTLLHETAHLSVSNMPLHVWFNEGYAQYYAGQNDLHKHILVARAFFGQHIIPLHQIEYLPAMNHDKAQIAYAQSVAMFSYIVDYFGEGLVGKCLQLSKEKQNFSKAFQAAFLMTPEQFEKHWKEKNRKAFRFYLFMDQNNIIWILAPIIVIIGFILARIRYRRKMEEWEKEEEEEEIEDENYMSSRP